MLKHYASQLLKNNIPVCYIIRGPSGCGKTTIAKNQLLKVKNGQLYTEDATPETVPLMIVDDYNLTDNDWKPLAKSARDRGYVVVVHSLNGLSSNEMLNRGCTLEQITLSKIQSKQYKPTQPSYYGIFVSGLEDFDIVQKTPLHITTSTIAGDYERFGDEIDVSVIGYNENQAGKCLIIEKNELCNSVRIRFPHITMETNAGYKPVDVGKNIVPEETKEIGNVEMILRGVYGPMY